MATNNPLDFIPTETGETLLHSRANATFHRSFEYCLVASESAVYFYLWGLRLRPRWVRVPITEIVKVAITPYSAGRAPVLVMAAALYIGVVGAHLLNTQWWSALAFGAYLGLTIFPSTSRFAARNFNSLGGFGLPNKAFAARV